MKLLPSALAACAVSAMCLVPSSAVANETVQVPADYARQRVIKLDVTQMGLVLDLGSPITSVNLSHMSNLVFTGLDGALCDATAACPDTQAPTKLLLRHIQPISFKGQLPSTDGTRMLFVSTQAGVYRFQLKPVSKTPAYTLVQIGSGFPAPIPGSFLQ